jgi:hypothetical protein
LYNLKKTIVFILLMAVACLFPGISDISFAVDHGGCLSCHRYPGLVRLEKSGVFKMLHIDEEKHLESAHAKTDCRECHPRTIEVPHTNVTDVDCTVKCHLDEKEKIDAIDPEYLRDFHKKERFAITKIDDRSSCRACHPLYPHSSNNKVRAFLNMHTGFLICESCHLKKENYKNLVYEWKAPEVFEFVGEPYGMHTKRETKAPEKKKGMISKMLKILSSDNNGPEGNVTEYLISRIAVFSADGGPRRNLENTVDIEKAKEFNEKAKSLGGSAKEKELEYFHRDIARKEVSVACDECHSTKGILDLRALGFSARRAKDLEYMNIKSLVTKYDKFVIPNLFGH